MKRNSIFLIVALFTVLLSCNSDEKMNSKGLLRISVATDKSVVTKAEDDVEISSIRLIVKETTESGDGWSKEYDLSPDAPTEEIELAPGVYQLTAIAGDGSEDTDSFSPCYKGSSTVTIEAGSNTETEIICQLATVKVAVTYASNVKDIYKNGFKTEVGGLTFTEEKIGTAGYLAANPFSVKFWYVDNTGGWRSISVGDVDQVNPREYYHINIEVKNEGEGAATISVKVGDTNKQDIKVEVVLPEIVVTTLDAENVEYTTAVLKGTYSAPSGNEPVTGKQKFYYKIKNSADWTEADAQKVASAYQVSLSSLSESTTYEYKFMTKGAVKEFTTKSPDITLDKNYKGVTTAVVYGELAEANRNNTSNLFFKYRKQGESGWSQPVSATLVSGTTYQYKALLENLSSNATYEYKFMEVTVASKQFVTLQSQPVTVSKVITGADYATISCQFSGVKNGDGILLDLKQYNGSSWIYWRKEYDANSTDISSGQLKLTNLEQNGTYCIDDETKSFTTLKNAGFDEWNKNDKAWFAGTPSEASTKNCFWDSGNEGAATLGKNPTSQETSIVRSGSSVRMESQYVGVEFLGLGKFAAGNLYIGHYEETYGNKPFGARIRFGRKFVSRPTQLKGWYHYKRGTKIDYGDYNKAELTASGGDKCAIYIALTNHVGLNNGIETAFEINNRGTEKPDQFAYQYTVDLSDNNKNILAYGSITDEESKGTGQWDSFEIDLHYRDNVDKNEPTYIIIVASASKYGDFFTGSKSSLMYIDDFELVYDYSLPPYK